MTQAENATRWWSGDPRNRPLLLHARKFGYVALFFMMMHNMGVSILKIVVWLGCGVLGLGGLVYFKQNGMLYVPIVAAGIPREVPSELTPGVMGLVYDTPEIVTEDGVRLHAWFMRVADKAQAASAPTAIFFHGNAGNIGHRIPNYAHLVQTVGMNVLGVEYRGYGNSTGSPSEKGLQLDAKAALKYIHTRTDIDRSRIGIFGRSLGGAVGIWLAANAELPLSFLVIENSFVSVAEMAASVMPFLKPVEKWLPYILWNKWTSEVTIRGVRVPILFLASEGDQLVPPVHMRRLHAAAASSRMRVWRGFPNVGHNDLPTQGGRMYWESFREFFQTLYATKAE